MSTTEPFPADALEANRGGLLSESQRRGFGALSASDHKGAISLASVFVAIALIVAFLASPKASPAMRTLVPIAALAVAAVLVIRATTGADALTRDLRDGRVESVEGPLGKRSLSGGGGSRSSTTFYLDVGDRTFRVGSRTFGAAPDAGHVRLYFLPRSRKVVNLERLENAPPSDLSAKGLLGRLGEAFTSPTLRERNEARAELAGFREMVERSVTPATTAPPAGVHDGPALQRNLVGTWSHPVVTVTFARDGTFVARLLFGEKRGRWSVDGSGRLHAEMDGQSGPLDASVSGDALTVVLDGSAVTLRRTAGA